MSKLNVPVSVLEKLQFTENGITMPVKELKNAVFTPDSFQEFDGTKIEDLNDVKPDDIFGVRIVGDLKLGTKSKEVSFGLGQFFSMGVKVAKAKDPITLSKAMIEKGKTDISIPFTIVDAKDKVAKGTKIKIYPTGMYDEIVAALDNLPADASDEDRRKIYRNKQITRQIRKGQALISLQNFDNPQPIKVLTISF